MTRTPKRHKRHAASRARKLTAVLSVFAFVAIGRAINLPAPTASTAQTGGVARGVVSHSTLLGASRRSATASVVPRTTKGVTTTRAS